MLGCALAFSAVFLGPWGGLRRAAYAVGSPEWLLYGAGFLLFTGLLVPGLYALAAAAGRDRSKRWRKSIGPLLPARCCRWA